MSIFVKFLKVSRFDKPHGILLLFYPCLWGLLLISNNITDVFFLGIVFFLGASGMRSLGCIWNDYNDKKYDIKVSRTKNRLIASNQVSKSQIVFFGIINSLIGTIPLYFLPIQAVVLAFMVVPLIITYPFMKRITWWPQFWLGINFNWGILVGSSSVGSHLISIPIILFYLGSVFWTVGYDTIYGFQDIKDDEKIGIKSTAVKFKKKPKTFLLFVYLVAISLWTMSLLMLNENAIKLFFFLSAFTLLLIKVMLTNFKKPSSCNQTFIYNSYFSFLITVILFF